MNVPGVEIAEDGVERRGLDPVQRGFAAIGGLDLVALVGKDELEVLADGRIGIDHQDSIEHAHRIGRNGPALKRIARCQMPTAYVSCSRDVRFRCAHIRCDPPHNEAAPSALKSLKQRPDTPEVGPDQSGSGPGG